jgi:hypothetical protein
MMRWMTTRQMLDRFDSEWVLIGDPRTDESLEVEAGYVVWHSKDRDEVYRKAIELRPRRFALLYTGRMPEGTAIVLTATTDRQLPAMLGD